MSNNHHTPIPTNASANASTFNTPLGQLDQAIDNVTKVSNFAATTDPTVNDDTGDSYSIGSFWLNTTNNKLYVATDVTLGAAVWVQINDVADLDIDSLPSATPTTSDTVIIKDVDDTNSVKEVTISDVLALSDAAAITAVARLSHRETSGTDGGSTVTATWTARPLTTEESDPSNIVSVSSNQFTPIAGDYRVQVWVSNYNSSNAKLRLFNVTQATAVNIPSLNNTANSAQNVGGYVNLIAEITANGTDAYRVEHWVNSGQATDGMGRAASSGVDELYMQIVLEKLD